MAMDGLIKEYAVIKRATFSETVANAQGQLANCPWFSAIAKNLIDDRTIQRHERERRRQEIHHHRERADNEDEERTASAPPPFRHRHSAEEREREVRHDDGTTGNPGVRHDGHVTEKGLRQWHAGVYPERH